MMPLCGYAVHQDRLIGNKFLYKSAGMDLGQVLDKEFIKPLALVGFGYFEFECLVFHVDAL